MRMLHTFSNERHALTFSEFLTREEIENQLEMITNRDWGSNDYGTIQCRVWIIDEDDLDIAHQWLEIFQKDPQDPRFHQKSLPTAPPVTIQVKTSDTTKKPPLGRPQRKPMETLTIYLIVICTILHLFSKTASIPTDTSTPSPKHVPASASPVNQVLSFDYPKKYEMLDQLIDAYSAEQLTDTKKLPPEGQFLYKKFLNTPYWKGIYDKIVYAFQHQMSFPAVDEPMFEKYAEGEFWRLITPSFLHYDFFHLFFNMIWLLVLGSQIEQRIGKGKYLLFILVTGVISNIAQYLMSGPNFLGFSGVLCAMIAFVWFRQKTAPWEGYQLLPATMTFITVFILTMAGIQMVSFFFEITGKPPITTGIANTAHLTGALVGYFLAKVPFFSWQSKA